MLRPALTVLGALLLAFLIACGAYGLSDLAARHSFETRASYRGVRALQVDGGDGDVHLTAGPAGSAVAVEERVTEGLTSPNSNVVLAADGVLHVSNSCTVAFSNSCGASYTVRVPAGVNVSAHSGGGDVSAVGLSAATVALRSANGNVTATFDEAPTRLEASSGNGDVSLTVPNTTYAVHASSGNGTVSDGTLRTDPSSPRTIRASSGNGNVTLTAAGAAAR